MPTGYTYMVEQGCSFQEFVVRCMDAFDLRSREDGSVGGIVDLTINPQYAEEVNQAKLELMGWKRMTLDVAQRLCDEEYAEQAARDLEWRNRRSATNGKFEAMLDKVRRWVPPNHPKGKDLKSFMFDQLGLDLGGVPSWSLPTQRTAEDWLATKINHAESELKDAERLRAEHQAHVKDFNEFNRLLRENLAAMSE